MIRSTVVVEFFCTRRSLILVDVIGIGKRNTFYLLRNGIDRDFGLDVSVGEAVLATTTTVDDRRFCIAALCSRFTF